MKEIYCPTVVTSLVLCFLQELTAPAVRRFLPVLCGTSSALPLGALAHYYVPWYHPGLHSLGSPLGAEITASWKNCARSSLEIFFLFSPLFSRWFLAFSWLFLTSHPIALQ